MGDDIIDVFNIPDLSISHTTRFRKGLKLGFLTP